MSNRKNEVFAGGAPQGMEGAGPGITFEVPVIDVPLPSLGKVYDADHPLHAASSLTITAMTAAQENILTNKALAKRGTLLTNLIQSCIKDKRINAREMLIGDRNTVMVALRISGYGPEYKIKVSCPQCGEISTQEFSLDQLPVRKLELEPVAVGQNLFEVRLPQSRATVRFKFLTGIDEEEIALSTAQKKKLGAGEGDLVTTSLFQMIVSINGVTDRAQISMALPRMPAYDSQHLRKYIQSNEPGMQLRGDMTCPNCDFVGEVDMPLGASFFWPGAE